MRPILICAAIIVTAGFPAAGQGINGLLEGKLVSPKEGQWAWYDLTGATGHDKFMVRQAVVGEEKVDGKTGYWVELEIVPAIGYRTMYKMLLTGPASDPKNVHKIIVRQDPDPPQTIPVEDALGSGSSGPEPKRKSMGKDNVETPGGPIPAERFRVSTGDGSFDIWINDNVPPMGIIRMTSEEGEMVLRAYGEGGESAVSAMDAKSEAQPPKVTVKTGTEAAPKPAEKAEKTKGKSK